jgi:hypothetical protein
VQAIWIFNARIYHMPFSLPKNGLYMLISAYNIIFVKNARCTNDIMEGGGGFNNRQSP